MRAGFALVVCLAIPLTALAQPRADTIAGWFDLSVPGGAETLASIRLDEHALTLPIVARTLHGEGARTRLPIDELNRRLSQTTSPTVGGVSDPTPDDIPVPLARHNWERLLALKRVEELANQYLIGYQSTNTKRDGAWRQVKLEVVGHAVCARQGYRGPTSSRRR